MNTSASTLSTTKKNNDNFELSKAASNYFTTCSEIKLGLYDSINELEACNSELFARYSKALKSFIESDFMYSLKEYPVTEKDPSGKRISKLDDKGNPIKTSNNEMVSSLSDSGFMDKATILTDLWSHLMEKGLYFVNKANNQKHLYNLVKVSVNHKLCDFTRKMNRYEPNEGSVSLDETFKNDDGEEMSNEVADGRVDIEYSAILWDAKNNIIHHNIHYLINNKKCHRMLAYIANIANISNGELFKIVYEHGYTSAIHQIVSALQDEEINISYLESMELKFPKAHNDINLHCIETWKSEGLKQIHEYMVKQELSY